MADKSIKFSVIIPVFNVEKYLRECLDSIINQTYSNYEIIIVNDGSSDGSADICKEYCDKYPIINLIEKENGGLSDARNTGMKQATGDYLVFVDSDDFISLQALENFNKALKENGTDILITRISEVINGEIVHKDTDCKFNSGVELSEKEAFHWVFLQTDNTWPSVKYIVSRKFIYKYDLTFPVAYYHEDMYWTTNLFRYARTFSFCQPHWYFHRIGRTGAITTSIDIKKTLDIIELAVKITGAPLQKNWKEKIICKRVAHSVYGIFRKCKYYNPASRELVLNTLKKHFKILRYSSKIKHRLFIAISKIIGLENACKLLNKW